MPKKSQTIKNDPQATWRKEAEALNYEEALHALDLLLARLQMKLYRYLNFRAVINEQRFI